MRKQLFILAGIFFCIFSSAQIVNIPDANFKAYLIGNPTINTNGDNQIQVSEATNFTGSISCSFMNIQSLTGIEAFVKIHDLSCDNNQLTSLDITKNTALVWLFCGKNQITSLDVSKNTALTSISCYGNKFTNLDVSKNIGLTYLACFSNQITGLDVSKNVMLRTLNCDQNQMKSLDVSKNTVLINLSCGSNQLANLDINKNLNLVTLSCNQNQLKNLDVSKNTALTYLECDENQIMELDVSKNTTLIDLYCDQNKLKSLNVKNGNNTQFTNAYFTSNPNLTCIQVDNAAYSTANWINKDSWASYNTNCNYMSVIDVENFAIKIYPNPVKNILNIQTSDKLQKLEIYSINGQLIKASAQKQINVATLPKGNYIVSITTVNGIQTEKIIKE